MLQSSTILELINWVDLEVGRKGGSLCRSGDYKGGSKGNYINN